MRLSLLSLYFFLLPFLLAAQNNGAIKGIVVDGTKQPLEKATIAVVSVQDSTVVTYSLTDDDGKFNLIRIPTSKKLMVHITHVSSSSYSHEFNLKPNETLTL